MLYFYSALPNLSEEEYVRIHEQERILNKQLLATGRRETYAQIPAVREIGPRPKQYYYHDAADAN